MWAIDGVDESHSWSDSGENHGSEAIESDIRGSHGVGDVCSKSNFCDHFSNGGGSESSSSVAKYTYGASIKISGGVMMVTL